MADRASRLRTRLLATFRTEARDHIREIASDLQVIARDHGTGDVGANLESLYRNMHTLKGAARSVSLKAIESLCQGCETSLSAIVQGRAPLTAQVLASIQTAAEDITRLVEREEGIEPPPALPPAPATSRQEAPPRAAQGPSAAAEAPAKAPPYAEPDPATDASPFDAAELIARLTSEHETELAGSVGETIRIEVSRIDELVVHAENLLTPRLSLGQRIGEVKNLARGLNGLKRQVAALASALASGAPDSVQQTGDMQFALEDLAVRANGLLHGLVEDHAVIRESVDELFLNLRNVRMMPVARMLEPFPLMVRDLAKELDKRVNWRAEDGGLEIDRKVVEFIKDPLIHMVRNAIDHGIEAPEERQRQGKPVEGTLSLTFHRPDSGRIAIRIADDGRGIDLDRVREAAVRLRLVDSARVSDLSERDVSDLLFRSGLSTSPVITTVSGHGLGLSIVRERVERLGGDIAMQSQPGKGMVITITVPESISRFTGLLVTVSGSTFLLPGGAVVRAIRMNAADAETSLRSRFVSWDGHSIPFAFLADVLGLPRQQSLADVETVRCVIVEHGQYRGAFIVDGVEGEREVLVKEFQWPIVRAPNVAAIGLLGTGAQTFVLRPLDLLRSASRSRRFDEAARPAPRQHKRLRVLVVDDSITTRTMERQLFETAGFLVKVAADGLDAWNLLSREDVDLVVSDIDMPRMNGFDLTERIRASAPHTNLPVILVTALESREDKEKGLRVGANAYVQKSTFDQSNLLDIVRRLV